jgi:hypothetical protein
MTGVDLYSALLIRSEIGSIERFPDYKKLVSWAGLAPYHYHVLDSLSLSCSHFFHFHDSPLLDSVEKIARPGIVQSRFWHSRQRRSGLAQ